jgi:hypothetical protein
MRQWNVPSPVAKSEGQTDWRKVAKWIRSRSISGDRWLAMPVEEKIEWAGTVISSAAYVESLVEILDEVVQQLSTEGTR